MDEIKKQTNFEINQVISQPYKYGFTTDIENESFPYGINEEIVKLISLKKNEPQFLLDFRLKSYKKWLQMNSPDWCNLKIEKINYNDIIYYSKPKQKKQLNLQILFF
jgi:Fe-S cluster assembly protein SufB